MRIKMISSGTIFTHILESINQHGPSKVHYLNMRQPIHPFQDEIIAENHQEVKS